MTSASTSVSENQTTGSDVSDEGLDAESLAAIRSLIAEEPALAAAPPSRRRSEVEDTAPPEPAPAPQPAPRKRTKADALPVLEEAVNDTPEYLDERDSKPSRRRGLRLPRLGLRRKPRTVEDVAYDSYAEPAVATPPRRAQPQATEEGTSARAKAAVLGYRPTPRHIALAALMLLVVMRPWLVVGLLFLFAFIMTGIFLILGFDGFWHGVVKLVRWYGRRRPSRAAVLHRRLDTFAMKWDAVLDRFPEGTVDGLYLPDIGQIEAANKRHDEAVARRLEGLRQGNA